MSQQRPDSGRLRAEQVARNRARFGTDDFPGGQPGEWAPDPVADAAAAKELVAELPPLGEAATTGLARLAAELDVPDAAEPGGHQARAG